MLDSLILTKFHNPLVTGRLTLRPRLETSLDESLEPGCRLVLVTAPAGYGKSTLVSAWIKKQPLKFSWLSLDSGDNEPRQFLLYLVGALQRIDESLGISQVSRIQIADSADREASFTDIMASLVNEITLWPEPFILAVDDCHLIKNPLLLRLLNFLIERQPPHMRLILLSREDLSLPLSRLRVRRQVVEIRQKDLQFSSDEAGDFLREGLGIHQLTASDISALEQRTEGWIAGLQLAGLSIKSDPNPKNFIKSFTGSDRYIIDYLMDEVFTRQPKAVQDFLLATSILDRFCSSLCDAVLEGMLDDPAGLPSRSTAMLDVLERSSLFLIPLDNQRQWFRYHHLFADLLRHSLGRSSPDKIADLHLRASRWLESRGYIQEAVQHAFKTLDWSYTAEIVERHAWNMILHSQVASVSEWCSTFPENVISKRPALCIFHGWALVIAFKQDDFPAANVRLIQAEAALPDIDPQTEITLMVGAPAANLKRWVSGHIILLRSFILMTAPRNQANPQALVDMGMQSYNLLPVEDIAGRSASLLDVCYAIQARSDAQEAEEKYKDVARMASSGGNFFGAVVAEYHRAHDLFAQGRLSEVISFCQQKKEQYEGYFEHPLKELPALALLDQAMGCALLEMNELSQAEHLLRSGLEVGQWMPREELPGYLALARLCAVTGDEPGMMETLRRLDMRWPDIRYCTEAARVLHALKAHPEDALTRKTALNWSTAHRPEIGPGIVLPGIGPAWNDEADYFMYAAWAQVCILLNRLDEALAVIQALLEVALEHHLNHRVIELSLLQAQAFFVAGQRDRSWRPLHAALLLAESQGYARLADQGPILERLFIEAARSGVAPQYIRRNLECANQAALESLSPVPLPENAPSKGAFSANDGLVEPLSGRESEILALLASGLSNAEIAARLYLSPNTMKAHTQNIYSKLDVHSRVQAVNKARELKLID